MNCVVDEVEDEFTSNEDIDLILHPPCDGVNSMKMTMRHLALQFSAIIAIKRGRNELGRTRGTVMLASAWKETTKESKSIGCLLHCLFPEYQYHRSEILRQEECEDPIDIFLKIFDQTIQEFIHEQRNLYCDVNASLNEIFVVVRVLLTFGIVTQSRRLLELQFYEEKFCHFFCYFS